VNFKILVFKHAEQTNNCEAARKYSVSKANIQRWKQQKQKLTNVNSTQKSFSDPKYICFHGVEEQVVQFVCTQIQNGIPVLCDIIKLRARDIAKMLPVNTAYQEFKASSYSMVYTDYAEKRVIFTAKNLILPEGTVRL
jgi:hypothetical protein